MPKKFLRGISLATALLLSVTLLSACGDSKNTPPTPTPTSTAAATQSTQEAKEEPVTIEWLSYQTVGEPDPNSEIAQYVAKKVNATFKFWFIDDQKWDDVLNLKLASGEVPDVMRVKNRNNIPKYVSMGILSELPEETIRKYAPNYAKTVDTYDTAGMVWNATKYQGKNYGFSMMNLDGNYGSVLEWRTDWLKNVGISKIPETIAEFETALTKFRNEDPDKNGKKDTYGMSKTTMNAIFGAYGLLSPSDNSLMLKDGKLQYSSIMPEAKDALALLAKWYKNELIDPEYALGENKGGYWAYSHSFMNNRIGVTGDINFYHYSPPDTCEGPAGGPCYQEIKKVNPTAEFEIGKPPVGPNGESGTRAGGVLSESHAITAKAMKDERKVETILKMLDLLHSDDEYSTMVFYGVKDKHYTIDAKSGNYGWVSMDAVDAKREGLQVFSFLASSPDFMKKTRPGRYTYADTNAKFKTYISPIVPPTDAATRYAETLKKLTDEAYINIITDKKPIESFDEYVSKFKSSGGDEVEKAATEAYNEMIGK